MKTHSIFSRHWWSVCLFTSAPARTSVQHKLDSIVSGIAASIGGTPHKSANQLRRGIFIASTKTETPTKKQTSIAGTLMMHTERRYFPAGVQDIETGPIAYENIQSEERDYPRFLKNNLLQYPLLFGLSNIQPTMGICVLSSPYFLLLRDVLNNADTGKYFSSCLALDVEKAFDVLKTVVLPHGKLLVRSGRMVITGIDYIRSAEFTGDNVIASSLYSELIKKPKVTVDPKACRLGRSYDNPVGGNRRQFICWFDQHGNFRFTPGIDTASAIHKFIELLTILENQKLLEPAETFNPLTKIGWNTAAV